MVTIDPHNVEGIYDIIIRRRYSKLCLVFLRCLYFHKIEFGMDPIDISPIFASVVTENSKYMFLEQNYMIFPSTLNFHFPKITVISLQCVWKIKTLKGTISVLLIFE
jgi:hypothetical protein